MNYDQSEQSHYHNDYTLSLPQIASILAIKKSEAKEKLLSGEIRSVKNGNRMVSSKLWVDDYVLRKKKGSFHKNQDNNFKVNQEETEDDKWLRILSPLKNDLFVSDIARIFGVHKETIRRKVSSGELKSIKYKRKYIIPKNWLIDYLREHNFEICAICRNERFAEKRKALNLAVINFCAEPKTYKDLLVFTGITQKCNLQREVTRPLLKLGVLSLTIPESPHDNRQQYVATGKEYR